MTNSVVTLTINRYHFVSTGEGDIHCEACGYVLGGIGESVILITRLASAHAAGHAHSGGAVPLNSPVG